MTNSESVIRLSREAHLSLFTEDLDDRFQTLIKIQIMEDIDIYVTLGSPKIHAFGSHITTLILRLSTNET